MITAVDTSALLSVLKNEPQGSAWMDILIEVRRQGPLIVCEIVAAEIAPEFPTSVALGQALRKLGITIVPSSVECAYLAGQTDRLLREHFRNDG